MIFWAIYAVKCPLFVRQMRSWFRYIIDTLENKKKLFTITCKLSVQSSELPLCRYLYENILLWYPFNVLSVFIRYKNISKKWYSRTAIKSYGVLNQFKKSKKNIVNCVYTIELRAVIVAPNLLLLQISCVTNEIY